MYIFFVSVVCCLCDGPITHPGGILTSVVCHCVI
jgi:hypothetical protein